MSVSDEINNEINKATFAREQNPNVERTICNRNKNAFLGGVCLGVSVYGGVCLGGLSPQGEGVCLGGCTPPPTHGQNS